MFRIPVALISVLLILVSTPVATPTAINHKITSADVVEDQGRTVFQVPPDSQISFSFYDMPTSVRTVAPVEEIPEPLPVEPPAVPVTPTPVVDKPAVVEIPQPPTVTPAPSAPVPAAPAPATRVINVALSGGQDVVDLGAGPVLFPLPAGHPPYIVEHDYAGGWGRFGTLSPGMQVTMTGLITGTYTVGQIINVPQGGTTAEFRTFATPPKVLLQTCVPGTNRMIVVGLY